MAACCSWRELLERGVRADRSAVSMWPRAVDSMGVLREERFGPTLPRAQEGGGGQPGRGTGQNRAQNSQLAGTYSRIHGPDWPRGGQSHGQDLSFGWRGCSCRGGEQKGTPHVHGTTPRTMDTPCPFVARATRQSHTAEPQHRPQTQAEHRPQPNRAQAAHRQSAGTLPTAAGCIRTHTNRAHRAQAADKQSNRHAAAAASQLHTSSAPPDQGGPGGSGLGGLAGRREPVEPQVAVGPPELLHLLRRAP